MTSKQNYRLSAAVLALFIAGLGAAALVGFRNYQGARSEIEADPPSALLKQPGAVGIAGMQPVSFVTRDGLRIAAWYVPSRSRAAVIVAHGTNSDRASMLPEIRMLADAGFGVLAFDWPGLGESEGTIRWGSEARNALTSAIDWTAMRPDIDACRIGGLGFSMGGYVLTQVAAGDSRLRAVVLESAPSNFERFVRVHFSKWGALSELPARWGLRETELLAADRTAALLVSKISPRPLLIIAQSRDPIITADMTQELYESARAPKTLWVIQGDSHGDYLEAAGGEYPRRLREFFQDNLSINSAAASSGRCTPSIDR